MKTKLSYYESPAIVVREAMNELRDHPDFTKHADERPLIQDLLEEAIEVSLRHGKHPEIYDHDEVEIVAKNYSVKVKLGEFIDITHNSKILV